MSLIDVTFFAGRPSVGAYKLNPLSAGRIAVLEERGNPLATGEEGAEKEDRFAIYEAMMVAVMDGPELADLSMEAEFEWQRAVRAFGIDCSNDDLNKFWQICEAEILAAGASQVKKSGGSTPGKRKARTRSK